MQPSLARAWLLLAFAERKSAESLKTAESSEDEEPKREKKILSHRRVAMALAWRSNCGRAAQEGMDNSQKWLVLTCAKDLAKSLRETRHFSKAEGVCRQALSIFHDAPDLHFVLGKIFFHNKDWDRAADEFDRVIEDALTPKEEAERWAYSWMAHSRLKKGHCEGATQTVRSRLVDLILASRSEDEKTGQEYAGAAKRVLEKGGRELKEFKAFFAIENGSKDNHGECKWAGEYTPFNKAETEIKTFKYGLAQPNRLAHVVGSAIASLKAQHPSHPRLERLLHRMLADALIQSASEPIACADTPVLRIALDHAQRAVALNPEGPKERMTLGQAYYLLSDYKLAEQQFEVSAILKPDAETLKRTARAFYEKGLEMRTQERQRIAFKVAIRLLCDALHLLESEPATDLLESESPTIVEQDLALAIIHYWLGAFHGRLQESEFSIRHLKIARDFAEGSLRVRSLVALADAYREAYAFDEAEQNYKKAISEIDPRDFLVDGDLKKELADAHLGLLELYLARGVELNDVKCKIEQAKKHIQQLAENENPQLFGRYHKCLGEVRLKEDNIAGAIKELLKSIQYIAAVDSYYYLACAYERQADTTGRKAGDLEKVRDCCEIAANLDLYRKYDEKIKRLRAKPDGAEKRTTPAAAPAVIGAPQRQGSGAI